MARNYKRKTAAYCSELSLEIVTSHYTLTREGLKISEIVDILNEIQEEAEDKKHKYKWNVAFSYSTVHRAVTNLCNDEKLILLEGESKKYVPNNHIYNRSKYGIEIMKNIDVKNEKLLCVSSNFLAISLSKYTLKAKTLFEKFVGKECFAIEHVGNVLLIMLEGDAEHIKRAQQDLRDLVKNMYRETLIRKSGKIKLVSVKKSINKEKIMSVHEKQYNEILAVMEILRKKQ